MDKIELLSIEKELNSKKEELISYLSNKLDMVTTEDNVDIAAGSYEAKEDIFKNMLKVVSLLSSLNLVFLLTLDLNEYKWVILVCSAIIFLCSFTPQLIKVINTHKTTKNLDREKVLNIDVNFIPNFLQDVSDQWSEYIMLKKTELKEYLLQAEVSSDKAMDYATTLKRMTFSTSDIMAATNDLSATEYRNYIKINKQKWISHIEDVVNEQVKIWKEIQIMK